MILPISEARKRLAHMPEMLLENPIIYIRRHKKIVCAAVSIDHWESMMETLEIFSDPDTAIMMRDAEADIRAGRLISHEDIQRELGN